MEHQDVFALDAAHGFGHVDRVHVFAGPGADYVVGVEESTLQDHHLRLRDVGQVEVVAEGGIAAKLQPFVDSNTLAGAVTLVASKDKVLDLGAVGFADIAARKPMRTDCMFWIASMTKPITAAGVMILVDEGKVKLDDPVEKYLPEFRDQMVAPAKNDPQGKPQKPVHPTMNMARAISIPGIAPAKPLS